VAAVLANLNSFSGQNKFKQAVLNFMSNILADSEVDELKRTFVMIDKNNDKKLTVEELKDAMDKWGKGQSAVSKEAIESLIKMADINGDGTLSYEELFLVAVQRKLCSKEERLWETFCKLDVNNDGKISKEEIVQVLGNTVQAQELIKAADTNGDGMIDYDEFLATWADKQAAVVAPPSTNKDAKAPAPNSPAPAKK
jgi:Ca2+-binding EF-hand superfamily protein